MKREYQDWIRARIGDPTGMCAVWTEHMVKEFLELRRVRGHALTADGKDRPHWWCMTPSGEIVDPTVAQFGACGGVSDYEPHDESAPEPVGKCSNCGGYIYPPFTSVVCSDECAREYEAFCFGKGA